MGQMRSCVKALLKEKKKVKRHLLSLNENDLSLVKYVKKGFSFDLLICLFFFSSQSDLEIILIQS